MRGSAKGDEPDALRTWKAGQRAAGIDPRYVDLSRPAQQATRQALYLEQSGQCVYCGRAIELGARNRYHVEHFRPRSRYPDRELAYANLFLSCGPEQPDERSSLIEELDTDLSEGTSVSALWQSYDDVGPKGTRVSFANVAVRYLQDHRDPPR